MKNHRELCEKCDEHIRAGQIPEAAKLLTALNPARVPSEWRLTMASLCRRAGLHSRGLAILMKVVHPRHGPTNASSAEIAEYAALLLRSGALNEALQTLNHVDTSEIPEALLYRAYCRFTQFEFADAVPALQKYVATVSAPYARLVGQVNLGFALLNAGLSDEAQVLLEECIRVARDSRLARLQSNALSLRAQVSLHNGDFTRANADLEAAAGLLTGNQTHDQHFIKKWKAFLRGVRDHDLSAIESYRAQAEANHDWSGLREVDIFSLRLRFDPERFAHLYFGTTSRSFREKICRELGRSIDRSIYVFGSAGSPQLDLPTGEIDGRDSIALGGKCLQVLDVLLRDFYRPQRLPGLFSELFADEHFNVHSSPLRVRQLIRRTRRWFANEGLPVDIVCQRGFYRLVIRGDFAFRVPLHRREVEPMAIECDKLFSALGDKSEFTAREACAASGITRSSMQRLLLWAIEKGELEKIGERSSTVYRRRAVGTKKAS